MFVYFLFSLLYGTPYFLTKKLTEINLIQLPFIRTDSQLFESLNNKCPALYIDRSVTEEANHSVNLNAPLPVDKCDSCPSSMAEIFFGNLVQILESIQHHDQDIRRKGEIDYHELQNQGNYVEIVTKFAVDDSKPVHFRQLIVVLLNQQISKDWRSFTQSSKGSLVQFSFDGCRNQVAILRTSCMHMLSKIVSRSSDSETKDILVYLSGQLTSLDVFIVTSTLKALCAIAEEGTKYS